MCAALVQQCIVCSAYLLALVKIVAILPYRASFQICSKSKKGALLFFIVLKHLASQLTSQPAKMARCATAKIHDALLAFAFACLSGVRYAATAKIVGRERDSI